MVSGTCEIVPHPAISQTVRKAARLCARLCAACLPTLEFKIIGSQESIYSVRIGLHYRALATLVDRETMVWFWIGSHADYDKATLAPFLSPLCPARPLVFFALTA